MFKKNNKNFIYNIIDMYLAGKIDASTFCDEFYYSYDLELDHDFLNENEKKVFSDLGKVVDRFSPFDEDLKKYPKVYFSEKELKKCILDSRDKLDDSFFNNMKDQTQ